MANEPYFAAVRRWILSLDPQNGKAAADNLEAMLTLATAASTSGTSNAAAIAILQAAVTALQTAVVNAQRTADQAPLWIPPIPSREEIQAITDTSILTEGGDTLFTEGFDSLFLESA